MVRLPLIAHSIPSVRQCGEHLYQNSINAQSPGLLYLCGFHKQKRMHMLIAMEPHGASSPSYYSPGLHIYQHIGEPEIYYSGCGWRIIADKVGKGEERFV